ncbi:MAG: rhodanese-like domain-containing protein [Myxococcus sp.]|nr:rhodanese-like domain-containing protein [Myxococcus sp.]
MDTSWLQWALPVGVVVAFLVFKRLGQVSRDDAHRMVKEGAKLIDVRSTMEFSSGHLPGAVNVPLQELGAQAKKLGEKDKPVILYCASGARSAMARSTLKGMGFTRVFNLGAMGRW